ncbi:Kcnh2, partial [Symbiodinium pilosum]
TNIRSASPTQYLSKRVTFESERTYDTDLKSRLHPNGAKRITWDIVSSLVLIVDTTLLPLSLAWDLQKDTTDAWSWVNFGIFAFSLLFWTADIVINLNTAVFDKGQLVFTHSVICW